MSKPAAGDEDDKDGGAVADMFEAHGPALLLYARQWVDAAAAEDVVQRVFVRLLASGRLPADARTWLFRCVRNEAISAWRSDRRRRRREQTAAATADGEAGAAWFVPRPEDRIDAAAAQAALAALPAEQREIVTLRIWSSLTLAETGRVTGLPVSTVHHHYNAALKALRQRLESPCPNRKT
jgi:RNA polymerase sigma-70 factor (ECF subfamily)